MQEEIKTLKEKYHMLLLAKSSYLHDLKSPVTAKIKGMAQQYQNEIVRVDAEIEKVSTELEKLGCSILQGVWVG